MGLLNVTALNINDTGFFRLASAAISSQQC